MKKNYNNTINSSYFGYITQAIVNNFAPLLFLTFQKTFEISLEKISLLIILNFGVQLVVDLSSALFVDKIGYRICIVSAHAFSAIGLCGLAFFPMLFSNAYYGIILAVICYAIGGGMIEVLISPIVEACPTERKEAAMSLLHSFYCWGHVGVVIISTLFFFFVGIENWALLACIWAVIPFVNGISFLFVPIPLLVEEGEEIPIGELFRNKMFWILCILMICSGASEQGMSQWSSAFAESGLHVSKTVGDLAGPCAFALLMGISRACYGKFSDKLDLKVFMVLSTVLCIGSYLLASLSKSPLLGLMGCGLCGLSVGIMWPGSFSMAAKALRRGGTALFAFLALSGDVGCMAGPMVVGMVSGRFEDQLQKGLLAATVFPLLLILGLIIYKRHENKELQN